MSDSLLVTVIGLVAVTVVVLWASAQARRQGRPISGTVILGVYACFVAISAIAAAIPDDLLVPSLLLIVVGISIVMWIYTSSREAPPNAPLITHPAYWLVFGAFVTLLLLAVWAMSR